MAAETKYFDNPHSPTIFVDEASNFLIHEGNIRITLSVARAEQPKQAEINRVTVGQLVLSVPAAVRLAVSLHGFLEQQGVNPSEAIRGGKETQ